MFWLIFLSSVFQCIIKNAIPELRGHIHHIASILVFEISGPSHLLSPPKLFHPIPLGLGLLGLDPLGLGLLGLDPLGLGPLGLGLGLGVGLWSLSFCSAPESDGASFSESPLPSSPQSSSSSPPLLLLVCGQS